MLEVTKAYPSPNYPGYEVLHFGRFQLDPVQHLLREGEKPLPLGSRALEILIMLAERSGQVVSKRELFERVWPKSVVQEATLRVHIAALRKALGDGEGGMRYVESFSGRGYRFVAPIMRRQIDWSGERVRRPNPAIRADFAASRAALLPAPLTRLIGRAQAVSSLVGRIPQRRFVSIVGAGGIGKTAVATAVSERLAGTYEHGVCFLDSSTVTDPRRLPSNLAALLDLTAQPADAMAAILAFLERKSMLIVLDSCEHVVESAASLAEKLLQGAPEVNLVATSREPLRAESECVYRLTPLELPASSTLLTQAEALSFGAIQLFIERASANHDAFEVHDSDISLIAQICARLEGNPLAIELAAARVDLFGVQGLAARMDDCLKLLTKGRRTALPRHQSLRATLDWSYKLLSPLEQIVLRRLSVFPGRFNMDCASAVVADEQLRAADVFDSLTNLVAKSLLVTDVTSERILYRLPDTTRAYAREKLQESDELARTMRMHEEKGRGAMAAA